MPDCIGAAASSSVNSIDNQHYNNNPTSTVSNNSNTMEVQTPSGEQLLLHPVRDGGEEGGGLLLVNSPSNNNHHPNDNDSKQDDDDEGLHEEDERARTTGLQSFIHLLKGYVGPGCLSLPWAISQLGLPLGFISCAFVAYWTSYNCWTVVRLKRYMQHQRLQEYSRIHHHAYHHHNDQNGHRNDEQQQVDNRNDPVDNTEEDPNMHISFAQVGEWALGKQFKKVITACICIQQLAVCTVFLSFIGENLHAVLLHTFPDTLGHLTHVGVITISLPSILIISCLPNLKALAPVIGFATFLLFTGFGLLGLIIYEKWDERPSQEEENDMDVHWLRVPTALCAMLYSYEGVCLILPVEGAMKKPKQFYPIFVNAMTIASMIFIVVGSICVIAFGNITNGSITAFLLEEYTMHKNNDDNDENYEYVLSLILLANTSVTISVLLTYPLQLYPCIELMGPWFSRRFHLDHDRQNLHHTSIVSSSIAEEARIASATNFSALPVTDDTATTATHDSNHSDEFRDNTNSSSSNNKNDSGAAAPTSIPASSATNSVNSADNDNNTNRFLPEFTTPGDSPQLRAMLVLLTYFIAIVIPNVQALISLSGAVAGTSVALIFPPLLQLAFIQRQQIEELSSSTATSTILSQPPTVTVMSAITNNNIYYEQINSSVTSNDNNDRMDDDTSAMLSMIPIKYYYKRIESYFLLGLGMTFGIIGTSASIIDIVKIYVR